MTTARGIRNNNPGNIRRSADPWQGLAYTQQDPEFFQFSDPEWGIRALARLLISYRDKYGLTSVRQIVNRWAPPNENDTEAYVQAVAAQMRVGPDDHIDTHDYAVQRALVPAIIEHENGVQPYSPALLDKGLALAGVINPHAPATAGASPVVKSSSLAAGSLSGAGVVSSLTDVLSPYRYTLQWVAVALVVLTLVGIGFAIYYRYKEQPRFV